VSETVPFAAATEIVRPSVKANTLWAVRATKLVDGKPKPCTVTLTLMHGDAEVGQYIGSSGQVYNSEGGDIRAIITLEKDVTVCDGTLTIG
jgi:hypothetical protein